MLIDFKSMLNKLTTPRTGATVVKLTTASNVGLYVQSRETESKVIKLQDDYYVFHIQPSDVILQGNYVRGSKIHVIENLSELKPKFDIVQLDPNGVFYPLLDIPSNYRKRPIDDSLKRITEVFLTYINGWDYVGIGGIDVSPICDCKIRIVKTPEAFETLKEQRKYKSIASLGEVEVMLTLNHHTGIVDIIIRQLSDTQTKIELAPGMFIDLTNEHAKLMFDTEVFPFGPSVLEQITKPFKRDEEEPVNVTKDAESVKLD